MRPRLEEQRRERAERSERAEAALRSIKHRPGASEEEIRDELARAYEEQGIEPLPGELDLAAATIQSWTTPKGHLGHQSSGFLDRFVGDVARALRGNAKEQEGSEARDGEDEHSGKQ
jgi:hypothetical protein